MLSRIAQTSRIGLRTCRPSRFAVPLPLRTSTFSSPASTVSPWIRKYASESGSAQPPHSSNPSNPDPTPKKPQSDDADAVKEGQSSPENPRQAEPIPFHKLPDLTQGIPSTFEAEMAEKAGRSGSAMTSVEDEGMAGGGGGDRFRDRRDSYISTNERNRKWWARFFLAAVASGSLLGVGYMGRNWEDDIEAERHPDVPNGFSPSLWLARMRLRWSESVSYYQDPAFEKLLPDPDPSFQRPYTLCISLDEMLVHSEWTREHGWRVAKRPGMDYFIHYLSQYYELVLFTTTPFAMGEALVRRLDPFHFIMWPLYREATKFQDGEIVKDLSYLNRDLSKVIMLDTDARLVRNQPENAIILKPWKGDPSDKELVALIPFLEYIHTMQYSDVRKVLKSFEGKDIPTEFARREALARKEFNKQIEGKRHRGASGVGALGSLFGLKPSMNMAVADGELSPSEAFAQGKMLQDIARERGIRNYEMLEKEIRENGEKWLKEEQEIEQKAQQEMMNNMMSSVSGMFTGKKEEVKKKA